MSYDAEHAVLNAILIEDHALEVALAEGLEAKDFLTAQHRIIFEAILAVDASDSIPDIVSVGYELERKGQLDNIGGRAYLSELTGGFGNYANCAAYSRLIIEDSKKHKLQSLAYSITGMISEGSTSEEIEIEINQGLTAIESDKAQKTSFTMLESLNDLISKLEKKAEGEESPYTTGLIDLDAAVKLEGGRLYVIAGRPAMGKSTAAQVIAESAAKKGISTLFFSLEMPRDELAGRMLSSQAALDRAFYKDTTAVDAAEKWSALSVAVTQMKDWPLEIENKSGLTLADIKIKANQFFRKSQSYKTNGTGLIVVDYLGLMKVTNPNRVHGLGEITKGLKQLAMKLGIPIIILHQLNRSIEQRSINDRRPYMSDLRDSGEIEEDADAIIFVYRDEVYNEDSEQKGIAELIIRKNRDGQLATVCVQSQLQYSRFANLTRSGGY